MDFPVSILQYNGSLLSVSLLSAQQTLLLSSFGSLTDGLTLTDLNGKISVGELVSVGGTNYTVLGSGTAQPGINILGLTIPTGTAKDMILLQDSAHHMYFVFPDGVPNATGMIAMVIDAAPVGYDPITKTQLCLWPDTPIETVAGPVRAEDLTPGMQVLTPAGPRPIRWIGRREVPAAEVAARDLPILVPVAQFGGAAADPPLRVSPQHRLRVRLRDGEEVLIAAQHLCAPEICRLRDCACRGDTCSPARRDRVHGAIRYICFLLDRHALVLARGLAVETLLLGAQVLAQHPELATLCPEAMLPCLPILTPGRARQKQKDRMRVTHPA
ncbi:Hint domain-containing protein [Rhodobacter viridis]|uniref:Hint domain-containing protein n=1 Tax=Rhodobacter viridis TaxID=1054202 RepID=A0A318U2E3_9RHOB|nr:Hint domain-containing protein [Rhodobacter viridis]PYF11741.1 Hint domain-containing protein [Rhodobacter viridis]